MAIHEQLPKQIRKQLKQVGWSKAVELAKVARRQREEFDCAKWLHTAESLPYDQFKQEIERVLNGPDAEPWGLDLLQLYKSQVPVIEQALEAAARLLGSDRSRGYCLEMICADFLAGANLQESNPDVLLFALVRLFELLPHAQRTRFLQQLAEAEQAA